jgi:nitroreductase
LHENEYAGLRSREEQLAFLVRYATLAPSNRNSQPWRFTVGRDQITLHAELSRWQRVSDSRQREVYVSLGCALENLVIAIEHFGLGHVVTLCPDTDDKSIAAQVAVLDRAIPSYFRTSAMFSAIVRRRTHHGSYLTRKVPSTVLAALRNCSVDPDLTLLLTRDGGIRQAVTRLAFRGNAISLADPGYRKELAVNIGNGNFGGPRLLALAQRFAVANLGFSRTVARGSHKALRNSPVFGLISGETGHRPLQIKAGQLLERLFLAAAARGLSLQPVSQLLENEEVQAEFARLFRAGGVPIIPFRLGYAEDAARATPRLPIEDVLL